MTAGGVLQRRRKEDIRMSRGHEELGHHDLHYGRAEDRKLAVTSIRTRAILI